MHGLITRLFQRLFVLALGIISIWLIVFVVFRISNNRLPWILALAITYGVGAYGKSMPHVTQANYADASYCGFVLFGMRADQSGRVRY